MSRFLGIMFGLAVGIVIATGATTIVVIGSTVIRHLQVQTQQCDTTPIPTWRAARVEYGGVAPSLLSDGILLRYP